MIGSAVERGSLICMFSEHGTTLCQKIRGSGPKDGLLGFHGFHRHRELRLDHSHLRCSVVRGIRQGRMMDCLPHLPH